MKLVDAHCHLEDSRYDSDREEVIERNKKAVNFVVNCGEDFVRNTATLELHKQHPDFIHVGLGLSPSLAATMNDKDIEVIFNMIREHKDDIVAVGEVGLDYHWTKDVLGRDRQRLIFKKFIDLADELEKPLVVHCRDAMDDILEILSRKRPEWVMMHHFSGNTDHLFKCLDHSFYISLCTGFHDKKVIKQLPTEYMLAETDSPYNCPARGKRNEPFFVRDIIALVSTIKEADVTNHIFENSMRFFSVKARKP